MQESVYIYIYIYTYGICCPWVCGGWDLDALGKFFRRRRRRRRPRLRVPLLFGQIQTKSHNSESFLMKNDILGNFVFRRSFFDPILELMSTHSKRLENPLLRNQSWTT